MQPQQNQNLIDNMVCYRATTLTTTNTEQLVYYSQGRGYHTNKNTSNLVWETAITTTAKKISHTSKIK